MSGGSYDYLCHKDIEDLFNMDRQLQEMSDRLAGLGYADDAARETQEFILNLRQFRNRIEAAAKRLNGVWYAVEWWDSGDYGEEQVKEALAEYRGEKK
jgi:hypothetical protein